MKRIIFIFVLCACTAVALSAQASRGGTMYVATRTLALKSSTSLFASTRATLQYGAQVTVLQVSGTGSAQWVEVRSAANSSQSGWTKTANLSARSIVASSGTSASAQEVALAGKGFNQEIENAYKAEGNLNYAAVDAMEQQEVDMNQLRTFIVEGRLTGWNERVE